MRTILSLCLLATPIGAEPPATVKLESISYSDLVSDLKSLKNKVVLVAGTGKRGSALSDDPLKTELRQPHGVNVDGHGRIYISDSYNGRVLRLE